MGAYILVVLAVYLLPFIIPVVVKGIGHRIMFQFDTVKMVAIYFGYFGFILSYIINVGEISDSLPLVVFLIILVYVVEGVLGRKLFYQYEDMQRYLVYTISTSVVSILLSGLMVYLVSIAYHTEFTNLFY